MKTTKIPYKLYNGLMFVVQNGLMTALPTGEIGRVLEAKTGVVEFIFKPQEEIPIGAIIITHFHICQQWFEKGWLRMI